MIDKVFALIKRRKLQIICVISGFVMYALAMRFAGDGGYLIGGNYLPRKGYGEGSSRYEIYVDGVDDKATKLNIAIEERKYKADEIEDAFDKTMSILSSEILIEDSSLLEISHDLNLESKVNETGVKVEWYTDNPKLLDVSGAVHNEDITEAVPMNLTAKLSSSGYSSDYLLPIVINPRTHTEVEQMVLDIQDSIKMADEDQITDSGVYLPTTIDGRKISYREDTTSNYNAIWALGIVAALLLYARERSIYKEELKHKDRQMLIDYPEIVSKLTVYVGAGMAVRQAWGSIVAEYDSVHHETIRYAYEIMSQSWSQLRSGISESKVYREFGRACKLKQYMKLSSILDQNRKSGIANLIQLLSIESVEAWEERKNNAKRMGEEASTKLLMPMFIMLGIVMVMIMIPSFMSFY